MNFREDIYIFCSCFGLHFNTLCMGQQQLPSVIFSCLKLVMGVRQNLSDGIIFYSASKLLEVAVMIIHITIVTYSKIEQHSCRGSMAYMNVS